MNSYIIAFKINLSSKSSNEFSSQNIAQHTTPIRRDLMAYFWDLTFSPLQGSPQAFDFLTRRVVPWNCQSINLVRVPDPDLHQACSPQFWLVDQLINFVELISGALPGQHLGDSQSSADCYRCHDWCLAASWFLARTVSCRWATVWLSPRPNTCHSFFWP